MKKYLVLALLILALPVCIFAKTVYPDYQNYVNDFSGTLNKATIDALNQKLSEYDKTTTNQIAVVLVPDLQGLPVEQYTIELAEKWKVGKAGKDNGVILLLAMEERKIRIEVGYGLEGDLTDAEAAAIARNIISPEFKQNKYDDGVSKGVDAIIAQFGGADSSEVGPLESSSGNIFQGLMNNFGDFFWLIFIIPTWLFSLMARSKSWYAGGIFGGLIGVVIAIFTKSALALLFWGGPLIIIGLLLDFVVSRKYNQYKDSGMDIPWFWGGGGFGGGSGSSGGFSGFGGGGFGGGGGGGDW
jgi:uncharacterized protein